MRFQIYKDEHDEFRWRLQADNNRIIADSGQGYDSKQHCREGIELAQKSGNAETVDETRHREYASSEEKVEHVGFGL